MPEALLRKVKAEELATIAKGLVDIAGKQGFIVIIQTVYDYENHIYQSSINVLPKEPPPK